MLHKAKDEQRRSDNFEFDPFGRPSPPIGERLEHILITGMFNTYFELIIHEMPLEEAMYYLQEMRDFYTAGWMKIMGQ